MKKPWDDLIAKGKTPPAINEQKAANAKAKKNSKEGKPIKTGLNIREQWANSLYNSKESKELRKANRKAKPWDTLISNKAIPPTLEEQSAARAKAFKNSIEGKPSSAGLSIKEQWANSLYYSKESKALRIANLNLKPWADLIANGDAAPVLDEQGEAAKKSRKNAKEGKPRSEGLSIREQWALSLYGSKESIELRKANQKPKPWASLIANNDTVPNLDEQKAANAKSSRNKNIGKQSNSGLNIREQWALSLYESRKSQALRKVLKAAKAFGNSPDYAVDDNVTVASKDVEELVNANSSDDLEGLEEMIVAFNANESLNDTFGDNESVASKDVEDLINANPSDKLEGLEKIIVEFDTQESVIKESITDEFNTGLGIAPETLEILADPKFVDETEELQRDTDKTATAVAGVAGIPAPDDSSGLGGFMNAQPTATATAKGLKRTRSDESAGSTNSSLDKKPAARKRPNRGFGK
ncbi:hypothetical protein [Ascidiimonas sp. W6]|uniref:hypothetical protein n=1 Tax=Ascidiimonas meishanensis TaxID=3128903 RepID=UPI0030EF516E